MGRMLALAATRLLMSQKSLTGHESPRVLTLIDKVERKSLNMKLSPFLVQASRSPSFKAVGNVKPFSQR
jgi:hypothetical protein